MGRTGGAPLEAKSQQENRDLSPQTAENQRFERGPQAPRTFAALDNTRISTYEILSRTARHAGPGLMTRGTVRS